jgi:hypothetical protein
MLDPMKLADIAIATIIATNYYGLFNNPTLMANIAQLVFSLHLFV